jgi:hypothetical protein
MGGLDWTFPMRRLHSSALLGALLLCSTGANACSSCGCTLSSDWDSQGFATGSGFRVDLRYDYINQSQLRSGTDAVNRDDIPLPQPREIERDTINRLTTLGLDYSPNADWGFNVQLPYVDRWHTTVPEDETTLSSSQSSSLGDVRVLARYQGFRPEHDTGIQFGLKLPSGSHDVRFATGTEAGEALDRGLQPGSGTTDLLLGAYRFGTLNQDFDWFGEGLLQVALDSRDDYRTGASVNLNAGVRYMAHPRVTPQLQLNLRMQRRDSGAEADVENSGGTLLDLSPGVSIEISQGFHAYGFVQVPLYQRVNGYQLAPHWTASVGLRYAF